jgi:hypothetical protein
MRIVVHLAVVMAVFAHPPCVRAAENSPDVTTGQDRPSVSKRINFVATREQRTANPPGWEAYDGSPYTKQRGYGWLDDLSGGAWDGGGARSMILPDGSRASPNDLGRLELANGHASHAGNRPVVFRIDLPDGWYRVTASSVWPSDRPLPLVDERTIKLRAHDVVFAGSTHGAPLKIEGNRLIEGSGTVEVTDGHLRIVMGDPAYGGWIWSYRGPLWAGWRSWWHPSVFAKSWYQKITRTVDPGFHGVRINSLAVEGINPPKTPPLVFRDFFNREDSPEINSGVADVDRWREIRIHPAMSAPSKIELFTTSLALTGPRTGRAAVGLLQRNASPATGLIRYATRVSLFTGEGSKIHSGAQEAGLVILGDPTGVTEFNSTFLGVVFDRSRADTPGWVRYRVGDGSKAYRTDLAIPDSSLPFRIAEGEYELIVDHDVRNHVVQRVQINGEDITARFSPSDRKQRVPRGVFGLRSSMDPLGSGVDLRQFFWYYRVEDISS